MSQADPQLRVKNRIKLVLDSLESNNTKKTAKLCKDMEQEFPKSSLVKGAVALVHAKQNKIAEAVALLEAVTKSAPEWIMDRYMHWLVLSAIKITERFDLAEQMYELSWNFYKAKLGGALVDQEQLTWIAQSLFGAYIRSNNLAKQKSHAVSMWKDLKNDQYYFWSVVAMVTPIEESSNMMLAVAERMIETWFQQGKISNQEQIEYYANLLLKQGKNTAALDLLKTEQAQKAFNIPHQLHDFQARVHIILGQFAEARDIYRRLLIDINSDEWSWSVGYFDNLFKVGLSAEPSDPNSRIGVLSFLHELQKKTIEDKSKYRGPFLAELEFTKRLVVAGVDKEADISVFRKYFDYFGAKSCFFRDIAPYVQALPAEKRTSVLGNISDALAAEASDTPSQKIDKAYRFASVEALRRSLWQPDTATVNPAPGLLKLFQESREMEVKKETTERMHCDDAALLAAHYALDSRAGVIGLVDAAAILEYAIITSKYNFQFRLLLLQIYSALGAAKAAMKQVEELDIKQIQLDTMGHVIMDTLANHMQNQDLIGLAKRTRFFHDDNRKNTNDFVLEAYKNNRYSKVKEIGKFQQRLEASLQLVVAKVSQSFAQLVAEAHTFEAAKEILKSTFSTISHEAIPTTEAEISALQDNADTEVADNFDLDALAKVKERWNNDISSSYPCKTGAFHDASQRQRLHAEILSLNLLRIVSNVALDSKKMTDQENKSFSEQLELLQKLLTALPASSTVESSCQRVLLDSFEATQPLLRFCQSLGEDSPADIATVAETLKPKLTSVADGLSSVWTTISDGNPVVVGFRNGAEHMGRLVELSFFISRVAVPIFVILSVWTRIYPARMRPKASDQQKELHGDVRALLRRPLASLKEIFARFDQLGTKDVAGIISGFETITIPDLPTFASMGVSSDEARRSVEHVRDSIISSAKDSLVNMSLAVRDKIKELTTLKF